MIYQSSGRHCLSSSWWPLNQAKRGDESFLDCIHLEMIELRKARHREMLWNIGLDELLRGVIAEQLVKSS